jgi:hypothetical protein
MEFPDPPHSGQNIKEIMTAHSSGNFMDSFSNLKCFGLMQLISTLLLNVSWKRGSNLTPLPNDLNVAYFTIFLTSGDIKSKKL